MTGVDVEIRFKETGQYLGKCHQWIGEPAPPGFLPGWSAASECWWVLLEGAGPLGGRWIIAGFDREAVRLAAKAIVQYRAALEAGS